MSCLCYMLQKQADSFGVGLALVSRSWLHSKHSLIQRASRDVSYLPRRRRLPSWKNHRQWGFAGVDDVTKWNWPSVMPMCDGSLFWRMKPTTMAQTAIAADWHKAKDGGVFVAEVIRYFLAHSRRIYLDARKDFSMPSGCRAVRS